MQAQVYTREPFQFRAQRQTVMVLYLLEPEHPEFLELLHSKVVKTKKFFEGAPLILDLSTFSADHVDLLKEVAFLLHREGLPPIATQGASGTLLDEVKMLGLPVFQSQGESPTYKEDAVSTKELDSEPSALQAEDQQKEDSARDEKAQDLPAPAPPSEPTVKVIPKPALVITEPVRSGQRIYAEECDLICTATVSTGAELVADGNIHVYAPLRGRAYAGANGNPNAAIFCKSLEAELVSIAGVYRVSDQFEAIINQKNVQIYLQDNSLRVKLL